jgi:hypothetical protein
LAERWYEAFLAINATFTAAHISLARSPEYLQDKLALETTDLNFSSLPFRFAEVAKVILDVYVLLLHLLRSDDLRVYIVRLMT